MRCSVSLIKMTWLFCHAMVSLRSGWELKHFILCRSVPPLCGARLSWALMRVCLWQLRRIFPCVYSPKKFNKLLNLNFVLVVINSFASNAGACKCSERNTYRLVWLLSGRLSIKFLLIRVVFIDIRPISQTPWLKIYCQKCTSRIISFCYPGSCLMQ